MDNKGVTETLSYPWLEADWPEAQWGKPKAGVDDLAVDGLIEGAFGEERSFGARPAPAPLGSGSMGSTHLGQVFSRQARGPHAVWAHVAGRDLTVTQLTPAPCQGHLLRATLGDMGFDAGAFDGDLRVRGVLAQKAFSIVSVLEQDGVLNQWGHRIEEGDILTVPPGGELDGRFQGRTAYAVVTAPWGLVMQRAEAFEWLADPRFWTEPAVYAPPPQARAACRQMLQGCSSLLRAMGGHVPASAAAFLRRELLDGVLAALAQVDIDRGRRQGVLNATRIVRAAEDFLESARQAVQIEDICQALDVSRRTLYRAFHEALDVSPKAYLRLKSMSAARARLLDAARRPTTVTQVALDHGFWELGRFSGAYRVMFGESPSETLRGAQGSPQGAAQGSGNDSLRR